MGGGGGSYFDPRDAKSLIERILKSKQETNTATLDAQVSELIGDLLGGYNNRDTELIGRHLDTIRKALEKDIVGSINLVFGGSISRHTYVDGLSDADLLVVLDKSELANSSPESVRQYFANRLRERLPRTDITEGNMSVKVSFSGIDVQLLPSIRVGSTTAISNSNGDKWIKIKPQEFAKALTKVNDMNSKKLVPMIKIAKGINAKLPENQRLKSYHIESLAIEIFKQYSGVKKTKNMLNHFFTEATTKVMSEIKDKTGQTIHVDDYLGRAGSAERRVVSNALNRISRKMKNADAFNSFDEWKEILG